MKQVFCGRPKLAFLFLFIAFMALVPWGLFAQTYHYKIVRNGSTIGKMVAKKLVKDDSTYYDIYSETEFRVFFSIKVIFNMDEVFYDGTLIRGDALSTLNGDTQKETRIVKNEKGYLANVDSDQFTLQDEKITFSIPELYFTEPIGAVKIFSQQFAEYLYFVKIGEHQYELSSDDGVNTYTYKDGQCVEVKVSRSYITFIMQIIASK